MFVLSKRFLVWLIVSLVITDDFVFGTSIDDYMLWMLTRELVCESRLAICLNSAGFTGFLPDSDANVSCGTYSEKSLLRLLCGMSSSCLSMLRLSNVHVDVNTRGVEVLFLLESERAASRC